MVQKVDKYNLIKVQSSKYKVHVLFRGMRERHLQKSVCKFQEYANVSCKLNNDACKLFSFSL